ncbi:hypothetical protein GJ744_006337 [Endocarpon pusillum]|uniref:Histone deacetylase complex subunit SAP30 Sin3 binding domain-containing protein n=1 Tax=Endocarpon pusillum TaxID=364733 RepID=A0A8H7E874_9EURO|nr:hypothetical protein GJ744_006337 [Endocarpon pusillum]
MSTTSMISKSKKGGISQQYIGENGVSVSLHRSAQHGTSSVLVDSVDPDIPRIPWHDMDLKDLHTYRHAYRLNTPSSQTNPQAHLIFANAARKGLHSPSVVAARRRQRQLKKSRKAMAGGLKERSSSRLKGAANGAANDTSAIDNNECDKHTKEQLAMAVRKHFNAMSVSEGEVVARFTYVVRQIAGSIDGDGDKGFRMRFKP